MYGPYFDRVAARATNETHLVDVRRARRQFQDLTGKVEEDEPWFEERMALFVEWYILDRKDKDGLNPAERFLIDELKELNAKEIEIYEGLTSTHRSLFRIDSLSSEKVGMTDMIGGGLWSVVQKEPIAGIQKGDLVDVRIIPFLGELYLSRGMIFHPRVANENILKMLEDAHTRGILCFQLVDLLASLRLRFDRYRNVKVKHVYRLLPQWDPTQHNSGES